MRDCWTSARSLLLQLLAHGSHSVQTTAYKTLTVGLTHFTSQQASVCVCVQTALNSTPPSFPPSLCVHFLDHLCCHAPFSPHDDIILSAAALLKTSLSTVRVSNDHWMTEHLLHRLPYIEVPTLCDIDLHSVLCVVGVGIAGER